MGYSMLARIPEHVFHPKTKPKPIEICAHSPIDHIKKGIFRFFKKVTLRAAILDKLPCHMDLLLPTRFSLHLKKIPSLCGGDVSWRYIEIY